MVYHVELMLFGILFFIVILEPYAYRMYTSFYVCTYLEV